jgi:hypothetical protein
MIELEVLRGAGYTFERRIALAEVLRHFFEELMGRDLSEAAFIIQLMDWDDEDPSSTPARQAADGTLYAYVTVVEDRRIIYQHPHPVEEILVIPLRRLLASVHPGGEHWAFRLVGEGAGKASVIVPVPEVAGRVDLHPAERRRRVFHIEELPDDDPPATTLKDLNVRPGTLDGVTEIHGTDTPLGIVIDGQVHAELMQRPFSSAVEEGGFVIGHRYSDSEVPGRSLLEVTSIVPAESTGSSLLRFTFTGESFLRLADLVARRGRDEHILGWFHTHLFPASPGFALSSIDVRLHETTFARPWQVAALINLDRGHRVLRWFRVQAGIVHEAPVWVAGR